MDLTGEEQKGVEDAVDEAFMKAADDLDLKGFMAQPAPKPATKADDDDDKKDKTSDSIVPQDDVPGSNTEADISLRIGSAASGGGAGNDLSTVPQGKLPNSNPGKSFPRKELKAYAKHVAEKVAKSRPLKLQRTIAKRAQKFIVGYVGKVAKDMSPAAACSKLKDDNGELTAVERGMLGAACARQTKKLSRKFPGACGEKKCRKGWLCKKCVKKVLRKAVDMPDTNATVEAPPPLGTTASVQVRATPDGQFETWNTSTGSPVDGPFASYDAASEAMTKSVSSKLVNELQALGEVTTSGGGAKLKLDSPSQISDAIAIARRYGAQANIGGPNEVVLRGYMQKSTSGGTMDVSPKPADNIEGSPTGGGTMELKAMEDELEKRARKLLKADDDSDELEKALASILQSKKTIDGFSTKMYQMTADPSFKV